MDKSEISNHADLNACFRNISAVSRRRPWKTLLYLYSHGRNPCDHSEKAACSESKVPELTQILTDDTVVQRAFPQDRLLPPKRKRLRELLGVLGWIHCNQTSSCNGESCHSSIGQVGGGSTTRVCFNLGRLRSIPSNQHEVQCDTERLFFSLP